MPRDRIGELLCQPASVAGLNLKNRIVMAPMTRSFSKDGIPTSKVAAYYKARASCGLIITEGTVIDHPAANGYKDVPRFYGEKPLLGWKKVVDAVHEEGAKIFPQLWHVGKVRRLGQEPDPSVPAYGPMEIKKEGRVIVKGMTQEDISDVVTAFANAAREAEKLGFDGVEIHGAHGYLIDQFFFSGTNQRQDGYGGSLENRCRFAAEVVSAARSQVSSSFPICFRFSQWKMTDYNARLCENEKELERMLGILVSAGVDIFHSSTRKFWLPEFSGSPLTLAGWTQKLSGKPAIAVGSVGLLEDFISTFKPDFEGDSGITSLSRLQGPLSSGEFSLVAVGRALISNPDFAKKVASGRYEDLIPYSKQMLEDLS